ncbi:MAG: carboxypeptidase M32, partial [Chitinophagaceae bacterium]
MTSSSSLYQQYVKKMQQIADLRNIQAVLGWDQETYLPPKGAWGRSRQMTTLSVFSHQLFSDP